MSTTSVRDDGVRERLPTRAGLLVADAGRRVLWWLPALALLGAYAWSQAWLCDDAFISFRYARNLIDGHGLVFNLGERVEGYTNFLWVLQLAAVWKLFGVPPEHTVHVLSALCTAGVCVVVARLARRTPFVARRGLAVGGALTLLAVNRNVAVWTTSGLETREFTLWIVLALALSARGARTAEAASLAWASLCWALAELTRPEAPLLFGVAGAWLAFELLRARQLRVRLLLAYALPCAAVVGAHYLWRHAYYGDWLPNTYYAKHVRPWPEAGAHYLRVAAFEGGLYAVLPVALLGSFARLQRGRDTLHLLSLLCIVAHAAYLVRIGGDHFELRPLDFYWPLLALMTVDGVLWIEAALRSRLARRAPRYAAQLAAALALLAALCVVGYSTALQRAHVALTREFGGRDQAVKFSAELAHAELGWARALPGLGWAVGALNASQGYTSAHSVGLRQVEHRLFWEQQQRHYGPYIGKTAGLFPRDAVMRLTSIGVIGYALSELTLIDTFGLTDRTIARNPVTTPNARRQMAHDRTVPPGYLEKRGFNLFVQPATRAFLASTTYAVRLGPALWMPLWTNDDAWIRRAFAGRLSVQALDPRLARNELWVEGRALYPVRSLGGFDYDALDGWTRTPSAAPALRSAAATSALQPSRQATIVGRVGTGMINSFDAALGDAAQVRYASPVFVPAAGEWLAFRIGGSGGAGTGVELRCDGRARTTWRGANSEVMHLVTQPLSHVANQACQLHVFDAATGPWGHVLADHFLLLRE